MVIEKTQSGVLPGIVHLSRVEAEIKEQKALELKQKLNRVRQSWSPYGAVSVDGEPIAPVPMNINPTISTLEKLNGPNAVQEIQGIRDKVDDWLQHKEGDIHAPVVSQHSTKDGRITRLQEVVISEDTANKILNKHHNPKLLPVTNADQFSLTPESFSDSDVLTAAMLAAQLQAARDNNPRVETSSSNGKVKLPESFVESLSGQAKEDAHGMWFYTILAPTRPKANVSNPTPPERHVKTSYCDFKESSNARQITLERRVVNGVTYDVPIMAEKTKGEIIRTPM